MDLKLKVVILFLFNISPPVNCGLQKIVFKAPSENLLNAARIIKDLSDKNNGIREIVVFDIGKTIEMRGSLLKMIAKDHPVTVIETKSCSLQNKSAVDFAIILTDVFDTVRYWMNFIGELSHETELDFRVIFIRNSLATNTFSGNLRRRNF
jgi:hypothetical protein